MIPKIAGRGFSFKGAGLYYLHDKGSTSSSERVAFTSTVNLSTDDPEQALRFMADTAMSAEQNKVNRTGAKQRAGTVFTLSLSWAPDENPSVREMQRCAKEVLAKLGLSEHEALLVGHNDTAHPHIHIICNLVHPEEGTIGDLTYSQRKLQRWASNYEYDQGLIRCPEREANAVRRTYGDYTAHQNRTHEKAERIALFFEHSDSGEEFIQRLGEMGLRVAQGDKKRIVVVDEQGKVSNLTRQLPKGVGKRDIEAKLGQELIRLLPNVTALVSPQPIDCSPPPYYSEPDPPHSKPTLQVSDATLHGRLSSSPKDKRHE